MSSEASPPQILHNPIAPDGRTFVVRIQRRQGVVIQGCDVYIGRRYTLGGWDLPGSKWANPCKVGMPGIPDVASAVLKYWQWIHGREPSPLDIPDYIGQPTD